MSGAHALIAGPSQQERSDRPEMRVRPLLIPERYDDLTRTISAFDPAALAKRVRAGVADEMVLVEARTVAEIKDRQHETGSWVSGRLADAAGRPLWFAAQGSARPLLRYLQTRAQQSHPIYLLGHLAWKKKALILVNPEPIATAWLGKIRPSYALTASQLAAQVRRVDDLDADSYLAEPRAQNVLRTSLKRKYDQYLAASAKQLFETGIKGSKEMRAAFDTTKAHVAEERLSRLLTSAHFPRSMGEATSALLQLEHVAAVSMLAPHVEESIQANKRLRRRRRKPEGIKPEFMVDGGLALAARITSKFALTLTPEQLDAAAEILEDLAGDIPMRRLLSGDVGSGKTVVFLACAAAMVASGRRVAIMVPSDALVHQTVATCSKHLPDLSVAVVSGNRCDDFEKADLVVGTTALVARAPEAFDLVIADEQHKFSRPQREAILADRAHLLEVSATAIPRTQALVELGLSKCTQLHGCPVKKTIHTKIWPTDARRALFAEIHNSIAQGQQIIVVYPGRRQSDDAQQASAEREAGRRVYSVSDFAEQWIDAFGTKVRVCHGGLDPEVNRAALDAMRSGEAQILIATTLIEVGVDLPSVRRAVVVQADRFGLSQLHQIRGRVARGGGEGHFDLYLPLEVSAQAMDRLQVLVDHADGFVVASSDCAQRGSGDITQSGVRQKGAMPKSPFAGQDVRHSALEKASASLHSAWANDVRPNGR